MGDFRVVAFKISLLVPGFRNTWASETRYLFIDLFSMQKERYAISWVFFFVVRAA